MYLMRGMSLRLYEEMGMLEREVALYRRLADKGVEVTLVTHGGPEDLAYRKRFPGIRVDKCCV